MITEQIMIKSKSGLHMRPLTKLVNLSKNYRSDIRIKFNHKTVDGKSLISLLQLGIKEKCWITLEIEGEDEQEAAREITRLLAGM